MKKKRIILQCIALAVAIAAFFIFRAYHHLITDSTGPEFEVDNTLLELSVMDPDSALLQGITARDDRDGDVTDSILVESVTAISDEHIAVVTYAAFDEAGNVTKTRRNVRYTDYHSPRFALSNEMSFPSDSATDIMEYVGAEDVLEGDISRRVHATLVSDTRSLSEEGLHTVRFSVTNSLGDTVQVDIPVEVYAKGQYNADLELTRYILYLSKGSSFDPDDYISSFTYGTNRVDLRRTIPVGFSLKYDNTVDTTVPGAYSVSYTMTYTNYNTVYTGHSNLIVIIEE